MGVPPESTTVEIDLTAEEGATTVRLVHHGLPPAVVEDHERGWAYFLGALRDSLTTGPRRWPPGLRAPAQSLTIH